MMFYLDNWLSVGPHSELALGMPQRAGSYRRGPFGMPVYRPPNPNAQQKRKARGPERELRSRADGTAYARREWRLHPEGRHRSRQGLHRLDDQAAARGRRFRVQQRNARARQEVRARQRHQGARRERRRAGAGHAGQDPADGALHLHQAGQALRLRRSAAGSGRPHGGNLPQERRRHPRSAAHDVPVARVLVARGLSRQSENAAGIRGLGGARFAALESRTPCRWCRT